MDVLSHEHIAFLVFCTEWIVINIKEQQRWKMALLLLLKITESELHTTKKKQTQ